MERKPSVFCELCGYNQCYKCNYKGIGDHKHACSSCCTGAASVYVQYGG